MKRKLSLAMLLTLSATASPVSLALGLGEAQVQSSLNAPLRATIPLTDTEGVEARLLQVELANGRAFEQAGLTRTRLADSIEFAVEQGREGLMLVLRSERVMRDPYLDLLLDLEWPGGQQLRHITLLFDPADYAALPVLVEDASRGMPDATEVSRGAKESASATRRSAPRAEHDRATRQAEVRSGDTLWRVAGRVRPDESISREQMMLALVEVNPEAFPSGNINEMRAGVVLTVPSRDAIERHSREEARRQIQAHNQAWSTPGSTIARAPNVSPMLQAPEPNNAPSDESEDDPTADADADAEVAEQIPGQRLTLLSDAELAAERGKAVQGGDEVSVVDERLLQLESQLVANQQALQAVREERDSLHSAMSELREELVALRDQLAISTVDGGEEAAGLGSRHGQAPEAPATTSWWSTLWQGIRDNTLALGGAAIALLLALWALRRRRHERDDGPTFTQAYESEAPTVIDPDRESRDSGREQRASDGRDDNQGAPVRVSMPQAEAISEADIFIAYGRFDQARDLLEASLVAEPGRDDLRLKLLMVHAERGDLEAARHEADYLERHGDPGLQAEVGRLMARYGSAGQREDEQGAPSFEGKAASMTEEAPSEAPAATETGKGAATKGGESPVEPPPVVPPAPKSNVIDYQPPPLDSEPEVRGETPMQPSVDFPAAQSQKEGECDTADPADHWPERSGATAETQWDVEEVAFEPLHLDNRGSAAASPEASQRLVVLARQLLDEGKSTQAHELLRQVLAHGDAPLKEEARDLIVQHNLD